eukprot:Tamp_13184.p1 GENE.Tamp_13184~~Tamp_13184.p1  ORF type:complete len:349 (+),score=88.75 Tamp_13184:623-1669(+)
MTLGEMSMEYTESALGARSNTGSTRSIPSRMGSTSNLPQVVPVLVAGLQEDTVPPFPEEHETSGDNVGKDLLQRLEADNDRLRGEVQSLLEELDQVVADNKLLVEDNQQLIDRNAELEARSPPHPLEDAAPIVQSNAADTAPEKEPDASRGSAGSSGMDDQQLLADNMKLASDNRQLLEDNNRFFSDNKKIIVDLSKLQQHGELLFRDNCKLSEDLNRALKEQQDSKAPADPDQDPAALNAKLIHDCELMAREIEMLEAELEKQKSRPGTDVSPCLELESEAADTEALLKDLKNLDEDNSLCKSDARQPRNACSSIPCAARYKHGHHTSRPTRRTTRPLEARFPTCTS